MGEKLGLVFEHLWCHASDDGRLRVLLVLVMVPVALVLVTTSAACMASTIVRAAVIVVIMMVVAAVASPSAALSLGSIAIMIVVLPRTPRIVMVVSTLVG